MGDALAFQPRPLDVIRAAAMERAIAALRAAWAPPPRITPSEWAERYRVLSPEASAEPGGWHNARAPHLVAPMDALGPYHPAERVVCKFSSQVGKTEVMLNFIGFVMDCDAGPILAIQPNVTPMGERFSKQRIAPMLRDCPSLAAKMGKSKARDSQNTILEKSFPGGLLFIGGANSPAGLASMPIRYFLGDEIDRWEITKEGDPKTLARKRMQTYRKRRASKELLVSSPTYDDLGISVEYDKCSQQYEWHLPCEHCGATQFPRLKHFVWDKGSPHSVKYVCEHCGGVHEKEIEDRVKAKGRWVCVKSGEPSSLGYYMNQWASPFARWDDTAAEWEEAGDDPAQQQAVTNTVFAEGWKGAGDQAEAHVLAQRAEAEGWDGSVPTGVLCVTIGADVQGDRKEAEVVGWGRDFESWSLGYFVLPGDPTIDTDWDDLLDLYRETWTTADGRILRPVAMAIDSGAYSSHVYDFVKRCKDQRIIPIKGDDGLGRDAIKGTRVERMRRAAKRLKDGKPPELLGVDGIKLTLYHRLNSHIGQPGYCHFPVGREDEYYMGLTSGRLITVKEKGKKVRRQWIRAHDHDEELDCRVYSTGALLLSGFDLSKPAEKPVAQKPKQRQRVEQSGGFGREGWGL